MNDLMIIIDMQNDFVDGALGTVEAQSIVPHVARRIRTHQGPLLVTYDTHDEHYLNTQEGHFLPVIHCREGSEGWALAPAIEEAIGQREIQRIKKSGFGSLELIEKIHQWLPLTSITLMGLCTDICVITNALMLKAVFPNIPLYVDAEGCAGVSPESHQRALDAMAVCQINIRHD